VIVRSVLGMYSRSSARANGTGMNGAPTRTIDPSNSSNPTSASRAAISAPTPNGLLTNAEMDEARDLSVGKQRREVFFHPTHHEHAPIQLDEELGIDSHARQHGPGFG
jgi:hypothetical protein